MQLGCLRRRNRRNGHDNHRERHGAEVSARFHAKKLQVPRPGVAERWGLWPSEWLCDVQPVAELRHRQDQSLPQAVSIGKAATL